ncbi:hypothetical protein BKA64DRAFT_704242 [Cadophora sp. MPI-SDFR-AT-0126]|nr:hypothetical protein BKA64DRAFT_704242 [Leotiomycetes sp. MPI-SDFR-AT-0126]
MSDARNCRTGSRCHARGSRSHGCSECLEKSGRGWRDGYVRRGLGGRGGEKIGWGRHGAVRLDDPPLRRSRDEIEDGMVSSRVMGRMGGLGGQGGIDSFSRRGCIDPFGGLGGMGGSRGLRGLGGIDEMGGRDLLSSPMIGRAPLGSLRAPMFNNQQPFADNPMLGPREQNLFRPEPGMGNPLQDRFMGVRQGLMDPLDLGMRSPSLRSGGSFDMRAMDRPRMPYGPFQGSPLQLQSRHPNYRPPYVEDYEGSEMEAELAAHHAALQQMQMMNGAAGGNPFYYDEGQYGDTFGGGPMMSGGSGGMIPGVRGGMMGSIH